MLTRTWKLRWTRNPDAIVRFLENIIQASFTFTRTVFFNWIFFPFWVKVGFPLFLFSPFLSFQPKTFFWRQMNKQPRLISTKRMNVLSKGFEPNLNLLDKVGTVLGQGQFGPFLFCFLHKNFFTFWGSGYEAYPFYWHTKKMSMTMATITKAATSTVVRLQVFESRIPYNEV